MVEPTTQVEPVVPAPDTLRVPWVAAHRRRPVYPRWLMPALLAVVVFAPAAGWLSAPAETVRPGHVATAPNVIDDLVLDEPGATTTTTERESSLRPPVAPIPHRELPDVDVPSVEPGPVTTEGTRDVSGPPAHTTTTTAPATTAPPVTPDPPPAPPVPPEPVPVEPPVECEPPMVPGADSTCSGPPPGWTPPPGGEGGAP